LLRVVRWLKKHLMLLSVEGKELYNMRERASEPSTIDTKVNFHEELCKRMNETNKKNIGEIGYE